MSDKTPPLSLHLKRMGIDTYQEAVVYMREDCWVCRSEGFAAHARIRVSSADRSIIATLNIVTSNLLHRYEVGVSEYAFELLQAKEGQMLTFAHQKPLHSLHDIQKKIYGKVLGKEAIDGIVADIAQGYLSEIHMSAFLSACADNRLNQAEIAHLTRAMLKEGERLTWDKKLIVDKHAVGGLPGNRTTLIVVPIVAAFGLTIPKTSSRAITSAAGTADVMEVLAPVELSLSRMRAVVEQENACIVWGGHVRLSPVDDILIRVERVLGIDGEGQLVASILSKKIAAGSTHVVIDIPVGPKTKVRTLEMANLLKQYLETVGVSLGLQTKVVFTDGHQPVGFGIGPALEARDCLAVLQNKPDAPLDLRERALYLAGCILEFSPQVKPGEGYQIAEKLLKEGHAWRKFQAIAKAQGGGEFNIPQAPYTHEVLSQHAGIVDNIDPAFIARIAALAGAPATKAAGLDLHVHVKQSVEKGQPLFTIHSGSRDELSYALDMMGRLEHIIRIV